MKTITVTIEGVASLFQHRFGEQAEGDVPGADPFGWLAAVRPGKKAEKSHTAFPMARIITQVPALPACCVRLARITKLKAAAKT